MSERALDAEAQVEYDGFDVLGYRVAIGSSVEAARTAVGRVLGGFRAAAAGRPHDVPRYEILSDNTGCRLAVNGTVTFPENDDAGHVDLLSVLSTLEFELVSKGLDRHDDVFHLHGAALCAPTRRAGLVLAGESRSGKTTLALGLMHRGFFPYTDDVALIDPETFELRPVRRAFHVTNETWTILEPVAGGPPAVDEAPMGYFLPPQWADAPVPVKWILFPEYRPHQTPQLIKLTPPEAASAILTRTTTLSRFPRLALSTASRLIERVECYRFPTGDLTASVAVVQDLVSAR
jgi:hypothetical protein